jgi:hypothetical protein
MDAIRLNVDSKGRIDTIYPSTLQSSGISEREFRRFIGFMNRNRFGYLCTIKVAAVVLTILSAGFIAFCALYGFKIVYAVVPYVVIGGSCIIVMIISSMLLWKSRVSLQTIKQHLLRVCHEGQRLFPSTVWFLEEHIDDYGVQQGMVICIQTAELHLETMRGLSLSMGNGQQFAYIPHPVPSYMKEDIPPSYDDTIIKPSSSPG